MDEVQVYSFGVGVEAEAAGRIPAKSFATLRHDLAALPWLLARQGDIVLAPKPHPSFMSALHSAGVNLEHMPQFHPSLPAEITASARPYGVVGQHLRRSAVSRYRSDVSVCRSMEDVIAAVKVHGPKVVLKAEFSSSGLGVHVCEGESSLLANPFTAGWVQNRLQADDVVTVEPWLDLLAEFSGEWIDGVWNGVSQCLVRHMRWCGQWLGNPLDKFSKEIVDFVFTQRRVELHLAALNIPATCGAMTCGVDVGIIRGVNGDLEVRILELNARTTMSHYGMAAKHRVPGAIRFDVVKIAELSARPDLLPLSDPYVNGATYCAVVEIAAACFAAMKGRTCSELPNPRAIEDGSED